MGTRLQARIKGLILILILITGVSLRAGIIALNRHDFQLYGDARNYHIMSQQLVEDKVYGYALDRRSGEPNAYVTPVYPLFLGLIYALCKNTFLQITTVRLIQAVLGGILTPFLTYLFIRRLFKRSGIALGTAFLTAVYPTYVRAPFLILTEVFALFTMVLYFYLGTAGFQNRRPIINFLAGAAFAIHILVRPVMLPLYILPFLYGWFYSFRSERKKLLRILLLTTTGLIAVMLPWWLRNRLVLGEMIVTSTGSGNPLLAGTYPYMKNLFEDYFRSGKEITQAVFARERIIQGFRAHPAVYLEWYTLGKIKIMFLKPWLLFETPVLGIMHLMFHRLIVITGALTLSVSSIFNRTIRFISVYAAIFLLLYLIFIPVDRYAYQHMFFLMLAASTAAAGIAEKLRSCAAAKKGMRLRRT